MRAYDEMAEWFVRHSAYSFYNAHYDRPAALDLIGDVAGSGVLDPGAATTLAELMRRARGWRGR